VKNRTHPAMDRLLLHGPHIFWVASANLVRRHSVYSLILRADGVACRFEAA
jgi:hypothetical protein